MSSPPIIAYTTAEKRLEESTRIFIEHTRTMELTLKAISNNKKALYYVRFTAEVHLGQEPLFVAFLKKNLWNYGLPQFLGTVNYYLATEKIHIGENLDSQDVEEKRSYIAIKLKINSGAAYNFYGINVYKEVDLTRKPPNNLQMKNDSEEFRIINDSQIIMVATVRDWSDLEEDEHEDGSLGEYLKCTKVF